jgi:GNAT superfamily N-acetyltransferase
MWAEPEARGSGVATALVESAIDWARSRGFERIVLDVGDHNARAIAFYGRMGFEPTGATGTLPEPRTHILEHERARTL